MYFNVIFQPMSQWLSWLMHYATSRKVAGLNPDESTGFFNSPNRFSHDRTLRLNQPLTEMSTSNIPGAVGGSEAGA
jgi:hypothetical protein